MVSASARRARGTGRSAQSQPGTPTVTPRDSRELGAAQTPVPAQGGSPQLRRHLVCLHGDTDWGDTWGRGGLGQVLRLGPGA